MSNENSNLENLINTISQKLGTNPDELKKAAQNKNANDILKNLSEKDAEKVKNVLSDKSAASKILSSPKAQQLLKKLMGDN